MMRCSYWKTAVILSVVLAVFVLQRVLLRTHSETTSDSAVITLPPAYSTKKRFLRSTISTGPQKHLRANSASLLQVGSSPCDHFEKLGVLQSWTGAKNECIEYTRKVPVLQTVLVRIADYLAWHNKTRSELLTPELHSESKMHYCKYDAGVYMSHTPAPTLVLPLLHNHDCAIIATRR